MNKVNVQIRMTMLLCTIAIVLFSLLFHIIHDKFLVGIEESEITVGQDMGSVPYSVIDIQEVVNLDGNSSYTITFESEVDGAPPVTTKMNVVPSGLTLDSEYMVDWVHVFAVYDKFTRYKDLVSMQYTGVTITEENIEKAINDVKASLINYFKDVEKPIFKWVALLILAVSVIVCFMLANLAAKIADKWASEDVWSKIQNQFDETHEEALADGYYGMDTSVFSSTECPIPKYPFRFWADDAEFEALMKKRKVLIDINKVNEHKQNDMRADYGKTKAQNAYKRGIVPDIDVSTTVPERKTVETVQSIPLKASRSIRRVGGSSQSVQQRELPKSTLGTVKRRSMPNSQPSGTNNTGFKSVRGHNVISDIDLGDSNG